MKTWIKRSVLAVFGGAVLLGGMAACSHHRHGMGWHAMSEQDAAQTKARLVEKAGRKLDLDEAQKLKLGALADKLREQRNALVGDSKDPRAEMQALLAGPTFDRSKAQALLQAKTGAVQSKGPEVVTAMADFFDSLKPEQQAKLREMLDRGRHGWRS